jgi:thioredoxin 1
MEVKTFLDELKKSDKIFMIDFWATWCAPCKALSPTIDHIANTYKNKLEVIKINTDLEPDIATYFGVKGIPNLTFVKNGQVVDQIIGAIPKQQIIERVEHVIQSTN